MLILGLNAFHADAAAVLVDGSTGQLVAAIAEERLNRVKHFAGFPALAIKECLRIAGASIDDVAHVAVARDKHANLVAKLAFAARNLKKIGKLAKQRLANREAVGSIPELIERAFELPPGRLKAKHHHVEHHLAHVASSFLVSDFDRAALMSIDGFGDFASTMLGTGEGSKIKIFHKTLFPHSMGIVYTAICQFIGYDKYGDEGKVMGLAPYGEPEFTDLFEDMVRLKKNGEFELNLDYFIHHSQGVDYSFDENGYPTVAPLYSEKLIKKLGSPRVRGSELGDRDKNLARSLQECLERVYFHILNHLHEKTKLPDLALAGGVALNSVANGKIFGKTPFKRTYIQPAATDDGTALGAAFWVLNSVLKRPRSFVMRNASTGPEFSDAQIKVVLDRMNVPYKKLAKKDVIARTAEEINKGNVVGWFQGRMEWGPRALGNRSILAHPGHPKMKEILNARIKHREWFRPFAPAILEEKLGEYYGETHPTPFMLHVYSTRPEKRKELAAVNHVDNTGRVQTVAREENADYYDVIKAFGGLSGTPVVLNTSFNENEPIVCTPQEAVDCYLRTKMDALSIGSYFCAKP